MKRTDFPCIRFRRTDFSCISEAYFEVDLVNRLQSVVDKQRSQIKKLDQSVLDVRTENDELKCRNDKLTTCTKDVRRKCRGLQSQLHEMIDERAEMTAKVRDRKGHLSAETKTGKAISEMGREMSVLL